MRLYVAVSYLDRKEWSNGTAYRAIRGAFELCLRRLLQDEGGQTIAAHTSLYFEDVTDEVQLDARPFLNEGYRDARSFFVDVLADGTHTVTVFDDPASWYQRWSSIRVELYRVADTYNGRALDAERAYETAIKNVVEQTPYDCYENLGMVISCPCRCSPTCGVCCPCADGTNCIEATAVALAAGFGVDEWETGAFLQLSRRASVGARLPALLRDELVRGGAVLGAPRLLAADRRFEAVGTSACLPLILVR